MNNQLDNLFKNKLEGHTIEPSPKAWSRVASGLTKKNKTIIWFRAAAALMITGLAFALWFYTNKNSTSPASLAKTKNVSATPEKETAQQEKQPTLEITKIQKEEKKPTINYRKTKVKEAPSQQQVTMKVVEQLSINEVASNEIEIVEKPFVLEQSATPVKKSIVIVYELKAVERIPELDLDQLPERKTGLKKVLEVANDMRTGESPLGGLRQAKDEILAFNFRKDEKNNNK